MIGAVVLATEAGVEHVDDVVIYLERIELLAQDVKPPTGDEDVIDVRFEAVLLHAAGISTVVFHGRDR